MPWCFFYFCSSLHHTRGGGFHICSSGVVVGVVQYFGSSVDVVGFNSIVLLVRFAFASVVLLMWWLLQRNGMQLPFARL